MSNSLNGKDNTNKHCLRGVEKNKLKTPLIINKLKKQILDQLMIPMIMNNWEHINNNFFLVNILKTKINEYMLKYNAEDLIIYKDALEMIEITINEHNQLFDLEKEKYQLKKDTNSFIYKTKMIRLKAEYEIYNLIYGKPEKFELYDNSILNIIKKLLKINNITFDKIKKKLNEI